MTSPCSETRPYCVERVTVVTTNRFRHAPLLDGLFQLGVIEAVDGNIKALLLRGRGYRDMNYLLLKAQRLAATKTEFLILQKAV